MREERQLSLEQVATKANIPVELLVQIERGDAEVHPTEIDGVLEAMGSTFREFALVGSALRQGRPRGHRARNGASAPEKSTPGPRKPRPARPAAR
jgi:transcriptional regulator with XRE-family HTH domain